ncbi:MAG TPA: hypothetical protein VMG12_23085 [Polyangiaceae bacterium]|nr:hypothetical protein [Polyangiaceae bacterium]
MDETELAALQSALLEALRRASSPEEALALLERASLCESARRWLAESDPRALQTATEIVQRWTERDDGAPEG